MCVSTVLAFNVLMSIIGQHAVASVSGGEVFGMLKHEVGVHRVQRVPITEGMGRVHTSTMSIVILPQPTQVIRMIRPRKCTNCWLSDKCIFCLMIGDIMYYKFISPHRQAVVIWDFDSD